VIGRNRMNVLLNEFQGNHKKVLTVCSAGCLRSPTAAHILSSDPWNFNTRAAGISEEYAIIHANDGLVVWADEIVVMDKMQALYINTIQKEVVDTYFGFQFKPVHILEVPDNYEYRSPKLVEIMTAKFKEIWPV
jgi:predicted protein tyrosine phosphatase